MRPCFRMQVCCACHHFECAPRCMTPCSSRHILKYRRSGQNHIPYSKKGQHCMGVIHFKMTSRKIAGSNPDKVFFYSMHPVAYLYNGRLGPANTTKTKQNGHYCVSIRFIVRYKLLYVSTLNGSSSGVPLSNTSYCFQYEFVHYKRYDVHNMNSYWKQ
jgi:hypothetical protein